MAKDRAASEEKVLAAVREMLPGLGPKESIGIRLTDERDPEAPDDSTFTVTRFPAHTFACRRGPVSDRPDTPEEAAKAAYETMHGLYRPWTRLERRKKDAWVNAVASAAPALRKQEAEERAVEGQQHFPFELVLEPVIVTNEYFYLCGNCGGIADTSLWQGLDYDEELDRKVPHVGINEAGFYRCPLCSYDHTDDDSGPGTYAGTLIGMVEQRKELLGDDDFDWKTRWEEAAGTRPDADAARRKGAEEERERLREAAEPLAEEAMKKCVAEGEAGNVDSEAYNQGKAHGIRVALAALDTPAPSESEGVDEWPYPDEDPPDPL